MKWFITATLIFISFAKSGFANEVPYLTKYCASTVFRETPYSDIRCAKEINEKDASQIRHFQFDYDQQSRLIEVRYVLNGKLQPYSDRFVRASRTVIKYDGNKETRHYFDAMNLPTVVSGHVYKTEMLLDSEGNRQSLSFFDIHNNPVANDFDIARYNWKEKDNGDVIEYRYDLDGKLQRNRPGFGYMITRFTWDNDGLLKRMFNLGEEGTAITPDEAGVAMTDIRYSPQGQFVRWTNLSKEGTPLKGMSNIAEIKYQPSDFRAEAEAWFYDENNLPQSTNWGAHRVSYKFDGVGNNVKVDYFNTNNQPVNIQPGLGAIVMNWSKDGERLESEAYLDKNQKPVASLNSGIHKVTYQYDASGRQTEKTFHNLQGEVAVHKYFGYATEKHDYTPSYSLLQFFDQNDKLVNNPQGYATVKITRDKKQSIINIEYFSATGQKQEIKHSAVH